MARYITVHRKGYHRKGYRRKAYTRSDGTHVSACYVPPTDVPPTTYKMVDKGKKGKTPKTEQWFHPKTHTGWDKDQPASLRRKKLHKGNVSDLIAARRAQALANVTTDRETERKAQADADYLFEQHEKSKK